MPLFLFAAGAFAAGLVVARWWIVPAGTTVALAWFLYGETRAAVHLEGNLDAWIGFVFTAVTCLGLTAGWLIRRGIAARTIRNAQPHS